MSNPGFHINTPLLESIAMSKRMGSPVYLKMESSQPSGSFKIRGIGHLVQQVSPELFCVSVFIYAAGSVNNLRNCSCDLS